MQSYEKRVVLCPLLSVEQVTFFFTAERKTTGNSSRRETGANKSTLLPLNRREAKNILYVLISLRIIHVGW